MKVQVLHTVIKNDIKSSWSKCSMVDEESRTSCLPNGTASPATSSQSACVDPNPAKDAESKASTEVGSNAAKDTESQASTEVDILNFREHLGGRLDSLCRGKIEGSRSLAEQLLELLRGRAQLEEQYATGLEKLANKLPERMEEAYAANEAVAGVRDTFLRRAESTQRLADAIDKDVHSKLESVIEQHAQVMEQVSEDGLRLVQYRKDALKAQKKAQSAWYQSCVDADASIREVQGLMLAPPQRTKIAIKALALCHENSELEKKYQHSITHAREAVKHYATERGVVLDALQEMEEKRGECLRRALIGLAPHEAKWVQEEQTDLEHAVEATNKMDPEGDVRRFIREHRVPKQLMQPAVVVPFSEREASQSKPLEPGPVQIEGEKHLQEKTQSLRQLLQPLLKEGKIPSESEAQQMRVMVCDPSGRLAFTQAIREIASGDQKVDGGDEENSPIIVEPEALDALGDVVLSSLGQCGEQLDVWGGREIMLLSQRINSREDSEHAKPMSLHGKVYHHPLWSKVEFWEAVLFVGLWEAAAQQQARGASAEELRPAMTPFLETFARQMGAFGIKRTQIELMVGRVLKTQAPVLCVSPEAYMAELVPVGQDPGIVSKESPVASPSGAKSVQDLATAKNGTEPEPAKEKAADGKLGFEETVRVSAKAAVEKEVEDPSPPRENARTDLFA